MAWGNHTLRSAYSHMNRSDQYSHLQRPCFRGPRHQNVWQHKKGFTPLWQQNYGISTPGIFMCLFYHCFLPAGENFFGGEGGSGVLSLIIFLPCKFLCALIMYVYVYMFIILYKCILFVALGALHWMKRWLQNILNNSKTNLKKHYLSSWSCCQPTRMHPLTSLPFLQSPLSEQLITDVCILILTCLL